MMNARRLNIANNSISYLNNTKRVRGKLWSHNENYRRSYSRLTTPIKRSNVSKKNSDTLKFVSNEAEGNEYIFPQFLPLKAFL